MSKEVVNGSVLVNGIEHSLKCTIEGAETVSIEAQNLRTGDLWKAALTRTYIENVTRKTGSFKDYHVFLEMLTDAMADRTDHVYVELLTYSDLLALKTGKHTDKRSSDTKRYLILTYKVKYDTVHYPLPLQYVGKMSSIELQDDVTKLQKEIDHLKNQIISVGSPQKQQKHSACCKMNAELKKDLELLKKHQKKDDSKMINALQEALRNLESDLIREKNKYQRSLDKKNKECKQLTEEVENLRSDNRALTVKLRSITTELNIAKRNKLHEYQLGRSRSRSITPDSRVKRQSQSKNKINSIDRRRSGSVDRSRESIGRRSSTEGRVFTRRDSGSRSNSRNSARSAPEMRTKARTPSPAGARFPRFDPSAYVRDKQKRIHEANSRKERQARTRTYLPRARSTPVDRESPSNSLYHRRPPSKVVKEVIRNNILNSKSRTGSCSSLDSGGSRGSLRSNCSSVNRKQSPSRNYHSSKNHQGKQRTRFSYPSSGSESEDKENKRSSSRKTGYLNSPSNISRCDASQLSFTKDSEIAEIDARLNALQSYLKEAQNKQYSMS